MADNIKNRSQALRAVDVWYNFIKNNHLSVSEAEQIASSYTKLENFIQTHRLQSNAGAILNAKELAHLLELSPEKETAPKEEKPTENTGMGAAAGFGVAIAAAALIQPEILEADPRYQKIENDLKRKWLKENKVKDFESKEGVTFLYGDPDDPTKLSVMQEAEKEYRTKHGKKAEKYDKKKAKTKKNLTSDAAVNNTQYIINQHQAAITRLAESKITKQEQKGKSKEELQKLREQKLKELGFGNDYETLMQRIRDKQWAEFARKYPEKAAAYALQNPKDKHAQELQKQISTAQAVATGDKEKLSALSEKEFENAHKAYAEARGKRKEVQERFAKIQRAQLLKKPTQPQSPPSKPPAPASWENRMREALAKKAEAEKKKKEDEERKRRQIESAARQRQTPSKWQRFTQRGTNLTNNIARRGQPALSNPLGAARNAAGNGLKKMLGKGAGRAGSQLAKFGAQGLTKLAPLLANPVTWIVIGVIVVIVIVIIVIIIISGPEGDEANSKRNNIPSIKGLIIHLEGPSQVANNEDILYKAYVSYSETKTISLTDTLPANTSFVNATANATGKHATRADATNKITGVVWTLQGPLNDIAPAGTTQTKPPTFTITLHPDKDDIEVRNKIVTNQTTETSSSNNALLPTSLPPNTQDSLDAKIKILSILSQYPDNVDVYKEAERATGIPWQVLAGKHFVEGGATPNKSLVSGREIGTVEPDIAPGRNGDSCSSERSGPGIPIPIGGGCGFTTLLDSAIYAGNHLKQKVGGVPKSFEELITALSRYNGGGNANCDEQVPYATPENCPKTRVSKSGPTVLAPPFEGDDDPYAMNYFDTKHNNMYLIYCADLTKCSPPKKFQRPGVLAIVRGLL